MGEGFKALVNRKTDRQENDKKVCNMTHFFLKFTKTTFNAKYVVKVNVNLGILHYCDYLVVVVVSSRIYCYHSLLHSFHGLSKLGMFYQCRGSPALSYLDPDPRHCRTWIQIPSFIVPASGARFPDVKSFC